MTEQTAELFDRALPQKCVARLRMPPDLHLLPPAVILYGARVFVLLIRCSESVFHYIEESSWRAPDPKAAAPAEPEVIVGDVTLPPEVAK